MERVPTAASMRLDGGHPALDLVNTVYGQVGGPVQADVLGEPADLVTFARRVGMADPTTPTSRRALRRARALREALDALLRAQLAGHGLPAEPRAELENAVRAALRAGHLTGNGGALAWAWSPDDAETPVHRLAIAAAGLLTSEEEMAVLRQCEGCCWLFLDRSRGSGRRWCSMADCGTEAKKRRYVERRRERRAVEAERS
jgi:predicted RNA-binding Zn ribbon-like protein